MAQPPEQNRPARGQAGKDFAAALKTAAGPEANTGRPAAATTAGAEAGSTSGSSTGTVSSTSSTATPATHSLNSTHGSAATADAAQTGKPNATQGTPAEQVAVQIRSSLKSGQDMIRVKLNPEALGHVEVRMEVAQDGKVTALVTAEKPETLDLLRQDSRSLERALQEAGLKADSGSLSFDLKGGNSHQTADGGQASGKGGDGEAGAAEGELDDGTALDAEIVQARYGLDLNGMVDIRV